MRGDAQAGASAVLERGAAADAVALICSKNEKSQATIRLHVYGAERKHCAVGAFG